MASPASQTQALARLEHHDIASVVDFVAEETAPASETTAIGGDELHEAYLRWSRGKGKVALAPELFIAEFDRLRELPALRGKIRKFGTRYFGINILPTNLPPRGLSRVQSAAYVGVSPCLFDRC